MLAGLTRTRTKGHVVDGSSVAVDLLQGCVAAGVPDGDGPIFAARHQQSPRWIQADGVHLCAGVTEVILQKENKWAATLKHAQSYNLHRI